MGERSREIETDFRHSHCALISTQFPLRVINPKFICSTLQICWMNFHSLFFPLSHFAPATTPLLYHCSSLSDSSVMPRMLFFLILSCLLLFLASSYSINANLLQLSKRDFVERRCVFFYICYLSFRLYLLNET